MLSAIPAGSMAIVKVHLLFGFCALLVLSLTDKAAGQTVVSCFAGERCTGERTNGSFIFDDCCLLRGSQSFLTSSGDCCECSGAKVEFGEMSYTVDEGTTFVSLEVVRYSDSRDELVISLTLRDGTARGGFDYGFFPETEITFTMIFLANETSLLYGIPIEDDIIVESTETFFASLSLPSEETILGLGYDMNPNPANLRIDSHGNATISITDNDFVNITVSPEFVERIEDDPDRRIEFVVRKSGLTERAVEVIAFTRNSSLTAVDGRDYLGFTDRLLRFEPAVDELSLTVDLIDDSIVEFTEELQVVVQPGDGETGVQFPRGQQSAIRILDDNDFVQLLFLPAEYRVREEQGGLPLSLIQLGESERPVQFSIAYNETTTTAMSGLDFNLTETSGSILLGSGESLNIRPFQVFRDGRYELDETIELHLLPADGETALVTGEPATVTIEDSDEVNIGFVDDAIVVSEPINFTVSVVLFQNNLDPGTEISLSLVGRDGIAAVDEDYTYSINPSEFVFTPEGGSVLSINVEVVDDKVFEGREDFSLILDSPQPRVVFNPQQTSIAITDNEDLLIDFDMAVYEVNETDPFLIVEVELVSVIEREIQLQLESKDGRATGGSDFEAVSQTLTFRPDSRTVSITVPLIDDDLNEGLEEFTLQLVLTDEQLGMPDVLRESTVRIFDDEVTFVEFTSESYTVSESGNFIVLVINKTGVTQEDVPVIVNLEDGTAKAGENLDYGPFNSPSLSLMARLLADEVAVPFGVVIREDNRVEYEESFSASLSLPPSNGSNVRLGAISKTTVYIRDNDMINVTISPGSYQVEESDTTVLFNVSRNDDVILDRNVSVRVTANAVNAGDGDFKADDTILTFAELGPRHFLYGVNVLNDSIAEGPEELFVNLSAAGDKGVAFHRNAAQLSIVDNDISAVGFSQSLFEAEEMNGEVEICLTKSLVTASAFTVTLSPRETAPNPPETFRARAGIDFSPAPVLVTFAPDDQTACGKIDILDDGQVGESREVFAVLLSLPEGVPYLALSSVSSVNVIVTDTPDVIFGFERTELAVGEAVGGVDVCVVAFNPAPSDALEATINFNIRAQPGTADSDDFRITSSVSGMLSNTTREACFSVQILDDMLFESTDENFFLVIENVDVISLREDSRMLRVANSPQSIAITITDNDGDILIGFEESELSVREGTSLELCVAVVRPTLSENIDAEIEIIVATVSDSAGPSDYTPIRAIDRDVVLVFNNSTRRACFRVTVLNDTLFEGMEIFTVQLTPQIISIGTSQGVSLSPSVATITINDNQRPLTVGFEDGSLSRMVQETVGNVSLCVRVFGEGDLATDFGVNVDIGGGGNAESQLDFVLERDLTLTFDNTSRRQCFDVRIIADQDDDESEEFFSLVLSLIQFLPGLSINPTRDTALITILPSTTPTPPVVGNDTVIGDPLFTVPLNIDNGFDLLPAFARRLNGHPNLCYEIHGEHNRYFSLVSDVCTIVNAHYNASSSPDLRGWNVISSIGIRAVNRFDRCVNVEIGVENGCTPIISEDGASPVTSPRYQSGGISVSKHQNKVRVSVPNCQNMQLQLVMWITCQSLSGYPMIRYDITRGINLQPTSHGLIGQFWNIPISVTRYTYTGSEVIDYLDLDHLYAITVSSPSGVETEARTFVAELYTYTWETRNELCFYAGNTQGGSLREITEEGFNDPVVEGSYKDYIVDGLFEHNFAYSRFSADMC